MNIVICDDDPVFCRTLGKYLLDFFKENRLTKPEIRVFYNGEDLLKDRGKMDLAFLDVVMTGISGIHTGKYLKERYPDLLVFIVTSFSDYLDEAMSFNVYRYLSKPVDKARLYRNLHQALRTVATVNRKYAIETKEGVFTLREREIIEVEACARKVIVHTVKGDYHSLKNMQYWADTLNHNVFFRTHRSFIVNMGHVKAFDHAMVLMDEQDLNAYLTRRRYHDFKEAYLLYVASTT